LARTGAGGGADAVAAGSDDRSTADPVIRGLSVAAATADADGRFLIFVLIRSIVPNNDIERFASLPSVNGLPRSPASLTLLVNRPLDVDRLLAGATAAVRSVDDRYCWPPCRCSSHVGGSLFLTRFFGLSSDMYDDSLPAYQHTAMLFITVNTKRLFSHCFLPEKNNHVRILSFSIYLHFNINNLPAVSRSD
jgi:hypothetical protein